ncbi:hypothetical protein KPL70_019476 [Citrus sinensis]|nr:hypothetical protein KPL70_019476 [Citrus sinensis]
MVRDIRVRGKEIIRTFDVFQSDRGFRVQNMFRWLRLPPRWPYYKLNSDGARKRSGLAGACGLIWDATGRWHGGFCMNIDICSVTIAELWGLYQGLVLAWQMGIRLLVVEIDSLCVTQLLNRNNFNATLPLVNDILHLLSRNWQVSVHHIHHEANFAVDFMASHALTLPLGFHHFATPPPGIETWLRNDCLGTAFSRVVKP